MRKSTKQHQNDSNRIHNNKYDYSLWTDGVKTTDIVKIGCPEHGVFEQRLNDHKQGYGCPSCGHQVQKKYNTKGLDHFRQLGQKTHNNKYDYSLWRDNTLRHSKVKIICPEHGMFEQLLNNHLNGSGCPNCSKKTSSSKRTKANSLKKTKASEIHHNKYDYSLWPTRVRTADIVKIICPEHGVFEQILNSHLQGRGCDKCRISLFQKTLSQKYGVIHPHHINFPQETLKKLQDSVWLRYEHEVLKKPFAQIASEHECNPTTVGNYAKKHNIGAKYFFSSSGENEVNNFVKSLGINTITNNRTVLYPQELDVFLPDHNIAIEYCGLYWHSEQQGKNKWYHYNKWKQCNDRGIQLLTIFEDEWKTRSEQIKNKIKVLVGKDDRETVYARKCKIVKVSTKEKQLFFDENHIQGNGPGSISYGLEYSGRIVGCASFINQRDCYYLNRYATSVRLIGGFSKLVKHFIGKFNDKPIISFADNRWSDGHLYETTGWILDSPLLPDYSYSPDGRQRFHKFNYRRKFLPKKLEQFDPGLSEWDNCNNNGILRIWDCGKLKFVLNRS